MSSIDFESGPSPGEHCTLFYSRDRNTEAANGSASNSDASAKETLNMLRNKEFPSFEDWKRRRANRVFKDEVVILDVDPKEELARRKARDHTLMSLLNKKQQDQFYFYLDYHERMQEKVENDRLERESRKELEAKNKKELEAKEKLEKHRVKKRLQHVTLTHDAEFVSKVPKSKYYEIVKEEQKKRQHIKTKMDHDEFWEKQLADKKLAGSTGQKDSQGSESDKRARSADLVLSDERHFSLDAGRSSSGKSTHHLHADEARHDMERISERGEYSSHPTSRSVTFHNPPKPTKVSDLFPKTEYPTLACFDMDLSDKKELTPDELALEALARKRKKRIAAWNSHLTMHQMAVTFSTMTKRILEERPIREKELDKLKMSGDSNLAEIFGDVLAEARADLALPAADKHRSRQQHISEYWKKKQKLPLSFQKDEPLKPTGRGLLSGTETRTRQASTASSISKRQLTSPASEVSDKQTCILSLSQAESSHPILEARKPSTLWNNYTGAGNVRFAPIDPEDEWYRETVRNVDQRITA